MSTPRTAPEPLTIAYIAMGAHAAIRSCEGGSLPSEIADQYSGELGFIDAVIGESLMLDRMADDAEMIGCFSYEIAEPFGEHYANALINSTGESAATLAASLLRDWR